MEATKLDRNLIFFRFILHYILSDCIYHDFIQILFRKNQNKWTRTGLIPIRFLKFIYSELATKICEISTFKSKEEISNNFVAFSEYMSFNMYISDIYLIWLDFSLFFSRLSRNWLTSSTFSLVRTKAMRITNTCSAQCKWKKHIFLLKEYEQRTMRHKIFWEMLCNILGAIHKGPLL